MKRKITFLILLMLPVSVTSVVSEKETAATALVNLINENVEIIQISKDTRSGNSRKTTHRKNMRYENGRIFYSMELNTHQSLTSFLGYMSNHWGRNYEFSPCDITMYHLTSSRHMGYEVDEPETGWIRLWVNTGYVEKIDFDKNGGDDSWPKEKNTFDLEIFILSKDDRPKAALKLIMKLMKENNCKTELERNMGSEKVLL